MKLMLRVFRKKWVRSIIWRKWWPARVPAYVGYLSAIGSIVVCVLQLGWRCNASEYAAAKGDNYYVYIFTEDLFSGKSDKQDRVGIAFDSQRDHVEIVRCKNPSHGIVRVTWSRLPNNALYCQVVPDIPGAIAPRTFGAANGLTIESRGGFEKCSAIITLVVEMNGKVSTIAYRLNVLRADLVGE